MTGSYLLVLLGIKSWTRLTAAHAHEIIATTRRTGREFAKANGISEHGFVVIPLASPQTDVERAKNWLVPKPRTEK